MVKAAIISLGSTSSKWTYDAMVKYFDEVDMIQLKDIEINISGKKAEILYKGNPLEEYDCIFAKGSFRYAQVLRSLTTILEGKCYMPIDPKAFTIAHDKLLTQLMLQQHSIPMPRTYISSTIEAAKEVLRNMNYPIIMKFPQGTQGKGVLFADSFASATTILDAVSSLNQSLIIQEYIETESSDIRVFVIGEKVVASMMRKGQADEKRSNTHQGGITESVELDEQTKEIAIKAAKATGAEICGVDILESIRGPLVIETNISPGLQGITKATKVDIAELIAKHLYKRTVEFLEAKDNKNKQNIMTEVESEGSIITNLDYRGTRILLPEVVTKASRLKEDDQVEIKIKKGQIVIDKFEIN
ncbi:RimK family alpha-L-glutamate ligase [Candidatus Woesearchaeota archaeon]|nr:RimK family alpha-L-glutamate ligase [Candidatus Woesearchaeota archaeon]MCF7901620.1 RimK family alpha-L-glutamate ligase [Candidatus Woesearchaeota archaeon]